MPPNDILSDYLAELETLLTPPDATKAPAQMRAGEVERPPSPYDEAALERALAFLQKSRALQESLQTKLQEATDEHERAVREIQMLGAAAADLAIAERLLRTGGEMPADNQIREIMRSRTTAGREALIRQALQNPDALLAPPSIEAFRTTDACETQLRAATWNCLESVRKGAIEASQDAIDNLLTMPLAVVREAAESMGADLSKKLRESAASLLKLAVEYIISATDKLRALLGPEGEQAVKKAVLEFLEELTEEETVANGVSRLLDTRAVYEESKTWMQSYAGEPQMLCELVKRVVALQAGFEGRMKLVDAVTKGLAIASLVMLKYPPWGPLGAAAAHIVLVGYILYSAYDHIDSDRFPYFDRVRGVRGLLMEELGVTA
ncbi:MAG: hypothetical protein GXP42_16275 [Chloroflexi bacterium]|nr:hypothetical protein [Chloroflexota bacterium]